MGTYGVDNPVVKEELALHGSDVSDDRAEAECRGVLVWGYGGYFERVGNGEGGHDIGVERYHRLYYIIVVPLHHGYGGDMTHLVRGDTRVSCWIMVQLESYHSSRHSCGLWYLVGVSI